MKELIYVTDRVIHTGSIHVYGVEITSSTYHLAAFLPLTCLGGLSIDGIEHKDPLIEAGAEHIIAMRWRIFRTA
ncbi:UNVERIFIED_CONTAM: hypothetical protein Slati_4221900 [Sesamum latifolium]|uniref:Uncharacterized protein n=1 Tax=Sesamum latifolium TaxID=2727402 RepID=A0AAW2TAG4_9LAMI